MRKGFSLVELLVVIAIILVLLAIAMPNITNALLSAEETAVAKEMQTIHLAQISYNAQFGKYAATLADLGPPPGARIIPARLASREKNGYVFLLAATPRGFTLNANPKVFGKTGRKTFFVDEEGNHSSKRGASARYRRESGNREVAERITHTGEPPADQASTLAAPGTNKRAWLRSPAGTPPRRTSTDPSGWSESARR
jgi:type IV pilus assembly protein PilA